MGRYHRTKNKKPVGVILVIALILIGIAGDGWFYFDNLKQEEDAVSETKILSIPPASEISIDESELGTASINNRTLDVEAVNDDEQAMQNPQFVLPELRGSDGPFREAIIRVSPGVVPWRKGVAFCPLSLSPHPLC